MMQRVTTIANDMAAVMDDTQGRLSSEILGDLSQLNMTQIWRNRGHLISKELSKR